MDLSDLHELDKILNGRFERFLEKLDVAIASERLDKILLFLAKKIVVFMGRRAGTSAFKVAHIINCVFSCSAIAYLLCEIFLTKDLFFLVAVTASAVFYFFNRENIDDLQKRALIAEVCSARNITATAGVVGSRLRTHAIFYLFLLSSAFVAGCSKNSGIVAHEFVGLCLMPLFCGTLVAIPYVISAGMETRQSAV